MKVVQLFELTFKDNTKLWASVHVINGISKVDTTCFGTFGKGYAVAFKALFKKDLSKVCAVAYELSKNKDLVTNYIDFVELESAKIQSQLINAC